MPDKITKDDVKRVELLQIVAKKGLKVLTLDQLKQLQILVEKKDYSHNKKAHKSKMKLLSRINMAIYDKEESKERF